MLTHPTGNLMLVESIMGLDLSDVNKLYITLLREHVEHYDCLNGIHQAILNADVGCEYEIVLLENSTKSQPETVFETIKAANISGPIFIKDSDNFFRTKVVAENSVCNIELGDVGLINPANKSYVEIDDEGIVKNIVEKQVISSRFCTGGYSFYSAAEFCSYLTKLKNAEGLYVSHIIYKMLLDGHIFHSRRVEECLDWGTAEDWNRFKGEFATLFVDIDGVLVENSAQYFGKLWGQTMGIKENIGVINELRAEGKVRVVLTTSRTSAYKELTERQLMEAGLKYDQIIYDLPHAKRIIINDYSKTAPYKNCDSINFPRNADNLRDMLIGLMRG